MVNSEYKMANPGFVFDYQLIDVQDFNGVGESEPNPFFYQNLGEAECVVATFMYMRLLGYPAEKISILTTYNGQKHLIRDVIRQRCGRNPFIGNPHKVIQIFIIIFDLLDPDSRALKLKWAHLWSKSHFY